ncbi:MAG: hypothetical protein LBF22_13905, partial [Deltaproteobacteria bacterium]|nr:hypothetical protein [Deltaproteobacteria bacterium]
MKRIFKVNWIGFKIIQNCFKTPESSSNENSFVLEDFTMNISGKEKSPMDFKHFLRNQTMVFFLTLVFTLFAFGGQSWGGNILAPNRVGLNDAINTTEATVNVYFEVEGVTISNSYSTSTGSNAGAAAVVSSIKTIIGATTDTFTTDIHNLVISQILNNQPDPSGTLPGYQNINSAIVNLVNSLSNKSLHYIQGNNQTRTISTTIYTIDAGKFIRMDLDRPQANLSILNTRIGNANIFYNFNGNPANTIEDPSLERSGVVNGFIGNNTKVDYAAKMGTFSGNDFYDIQISMNSVQNNSNVYFVGGGIIGLRSWDSSATISQISGNLFRNIQITTLKGSNGSGTAGPYIQGGGIIGLDAAFAPGNNEAEAYLGHTFDNVFTNITITSADLLMGGGLIGLNNNSSNISSKVKLESFVENIVGNGNTGDIQITTNYAIHGGGIIGLTALANAYLDLGSTSSNIFAGINVNSGTFIKGGGIIGVQNLTISGKFNPSLTPNKRVGAM